MGVHDWIVVVTKQPSSPQWTYPKGYWPRKFNSRENALTAICIIESCGGEAELYHRSMLLDDNTPSKTTRN